LVAEPLTADEWQQLIDETAYRFCPICGHGIPAERRSDAMTCSARCSATFRQRRYDRQGRQETKNLPATPIVFNSKSDGLGVLSQ
jgi:hypothetical protein